MQISQVDAIHSGLMSSQDETEEQRLGRRIRQFRESVSIRQSDLADALQLDAAAVSRIESGSRRVSTSELTTIATALAVSPLALLDDESPLGDLAMAARTTADVDSRTVGARDRCLQLMELYAVLEDYLDASPEFEGAPAPYLRDPAQSAEIIAEWVSQAMAYPRRDEPVSFLLLAEKIEHTFGIDVIAEPDDDGIDGLTATIPFATLIWINTARPRRRCVFTLAHELGHALFDRGTTTMRSDTQEDDCDSWEFKAQSTVEKWCNSFAASLLVPERSTSIASNADILAIYAQSGASWQTVVYRLTNLHLISPDQRDQLLRVSPAALAQGLPELDEDLRQRIYTIDLSASREHKPPMHLTAAALAGAMAGAVSSWPYASLTGMSVEEVIAIMGTADAQ